MSILLGYNTTWLGKWYPVFWDNVLLWTWTSCPLKMRPLYFLKTLSTNHTLTMHHIPLKWRPQLHYCKSLNLVSHWWVCSVFEEAVFSYSGLHLLTIEIVFYCFHFQQETNREGANCGCGTTRHPEKWISQSKNKDLESISLQKQDYW